MEEKHTIIKKLAMVFLPIAITAVTALIILMCFGVIKVPGITSLFQKEEKVVSKEKKEPVGKETKIVSPVSATDIFIANMDEWIQGGVFAETDVDVNAETNDGTDFDISDTHSSYPVMDIADSYGYGFLDLDFDGVLELVYSEMSGSGRYSANKYYRLNTETYVVEEVEMASEDDESDYDISTMYPDYPKLLKNESDGSMFYYCGDFLRVMTGEYLTTYGSLFMKDKKVAEKWIFSEYECEAGLEGNEEALEEYNIYENGEWNPLTKEEYEKRSKEYFEENVDLNLKWTFIDGRKFDAADRETKIKMLLEAYMSFSYDGFSFDKVETYDIEIKKEPEPQVEEKDTKSYSMADYCGMSINDVIAIWGNNYKVLHDIYRGGSGGIYYEDKVTFVFYFPWDGGEIPAVFTGDELIQAVEVWPAGHENTYELTKGVGIVQTYAGISAQLTGEYWVNEMDGGNSYSGSLSDKIHYTFTWENDDNIPRDVMVSFTY